MTALFFTSSLLSFTLHTLPTFERYARPEDILGKYTQHKKTKALKTL